MGYTTRFSGQVNLSRKLTMTEAKQILEFSGDPKDIPGSHPDSYMQWVPNSTLDAIGWDGGAKFYNYTAWLEWLCDWLHGLGISTNGALSWSGESAGDTGMLLVIDSVVTESRAQKVPQGFQPIDMRDLAEMALAQATKEKT